MKKSWKKTGEGIYNFYVNDKFSGSLTLHLNSSSGQATAIVEGEVYEISTKGFWKTQTIITDSKGNEILKVTPDKWYGATYNVSHGSNTYRLEIRNNPLAEWMLIDGSKVICSYGLDASNSKTELKITGNTESALIYDFLVWYFFLPIATEQTADNLVFNMALSPQ